MNETGFSESPPSQAVGGVSLVSELKSCLADPEHDQEAIDHPKLAPDPCLDSDESSHLKNGHKSCASSGNGPAQISLPLSGITLDPTDYLDLHALAIEESSYDFPHLQPQDLTGYSNGTTPDASNPVMSSTLNQRPAERASESSHDSEEVSRLKRELSFARARLANIGVDSIPVERTEMQFREIGRSPGSAFDENVHDLSPTTKPFKSRPDSPIFRGNVMQSDSWQPLPAGNDSAQRPLLQSANNRNNFVAMPMAGHDHRFGNMRPPPGVLAILQTESVGFSFPNNNTPAAQVSKSSAKPRGQSVPWLSTLQHPYGNADTSYASRSATPASMFRPTSPRPITPMFPLGAYASTNQMGTSGPFNNSSLSPMAAEFTGVARDKFVQPTPWNLQPRYESQQSYMTSAEPLNYRRLLDRNMSCNWKYIVDKIVHNNDQQASIFLQQKLKVGTAEQKYDIVQAIIDQAVPLMVNRFGNFLVQRCFEHGSPEQIVAISRAIRGNTLNLSMDAFGCHVVQKAFDCAPEEYKAIMVHELLRRIPETVIHRYACHVWQKLFELRWSDSPPQIMKYVNEALRGMWHEVALGETGSLVVQNIFENCLEDDKRPCINEVLASIDVIAHGQFGNWCIQHICEHGSIPDRTRAIEHVLRFATEYSIDQFASKVVEKCLKIGGNDFLDRYLDHICEARPDRPRMPLIDVAGDQFGNYLIQYVLGHADAHRREIVAAHIRKHMVSLRGSKYGSRVAMLCSNPAFATRPGPTLGPALDRAPGGSSRGNFGDRSSWAMYRPDSFERNF